ncbi:gamma-glutamylputrescine oxidoreductase, partial [Fusarium pseudoanthophilum]
LKIPCGGENSDILERVKQWLEAQHHKPWLMVIDNVDELDLFYGTGGLSRYFPTCAHGKLLITTRNRQVAVRATKGRGFIEVSRMTDSEARELLRAHLGCLESDIADLSTLALKLEYLPLILVQAAAFIQENGISVRDYLTLLKNDKNMVELLNEDFETSGRDPDSLRAVARTWMISFRQIRQQNKLAGELLSLVSTFHHQHISGNLLVDYVSCIYDRENSLELVKAIGVLKAFSIVSAAKDNGISMHRLIQLVMRRWLFQEGIVESFLQNAMMLMHIKLGSCAIQFYVAKKVAIKRKR